MGSYTKHLVCLGWVEGLVKLLAPNYDVEDEGYPDWASGVVCKIGDKAFWFAEDGLSFQCASEYIACHDVKDIIESISKTLSGIEHDDKAEYERIQKYLEDNIPYTFAERVPHIMEYLKKYYEMDCTLCCVVENVLRWIGDNLDQRPDMQETLVRKLLVNLNLSELEFEGIIGYMKV